jgi:hypothetical protein
MDWDNDGDEDYTDGLLTGLFYALDGWWFFIFLILVLGFFAGVHYGWWGY